MKVLLDTDTCIHALRQSPAVLARLLAHPRSDVAVSVVTEAELRTGAAKSSVPSRTLQRVENFLRPLEVLEFSSADAVAYAHLRARLGRAGKSIGPLDTFIAAHALSRKRVLVTGNEREFRRVPGLHVASWSA